MSFETKPLLSRKNCFLFMMSYIPGGRRIKKYISRMVMGFLLLPVGPIILFWGEHQAIQRSPIIGEEPNEWIYWAIRVGGFLFISFCFYRITSAIKLVMSKIPLTYNEIRNSILISSFMAGLMISLVCISISWIYHEPRISLVLVIVAVALIFALLIRRGQQKKIEKANIPSVKPQQAKDV